MEASNGLAPPPRVDVSFLPVRLAAARSRRSMITVTTSRNTYSSNSPLPHSPARKRSMRTPAARWRPSLARDSPSRAPRRRLSHRELNADKPL